MSHSSENTPAPAIVLASQSPRRRRLLAWLQLPYVVASVDTPEELDSPLAADPEALAAHLAAEKAKAARAGGLESAGALLAAFDTIVVLDGAVLGKPEGTDAAWRMLHALSGRTHEVVTGVALLQPGETVRTFAVTTCVTMRELDDEAIAQWMAEGTFLGCAGAYNIEAQVAEVTEDECYQNVAGLPLCHLCAELRLRGWAAASPVATCDAALRRSCRLGPRLLG